jgi:hypothetical protein
VLTGWPSLGESMNTYCVILCLEPLVNPICYPRGKHLYLGAATADGAIKTASDDNPNWRVIGIEPRGFFAGLTK